MTKKVIITGGSGFIGRALVRNLCAQNIEVINLDIRFPDQIQDGESYQKLDLRDPQAISDYWQSETSEGLLAVFYLAAYYDFKNKAHPNYDLMQAGLEDFFELFSKKAPDSCPFVYASSMAAIKPCQPGEKISSPGEKFAAWAYPKSKVRAENFLEAKAIKHPLVELVLAGVYSDYCELVPLYFNIERIRKLPLERNFFPGKTDRGLTYIHREEVVLAFDQVLKKRWQAGLYRFLIGQQTPLTYRSFHERVGRILHQKKLLLIEIPKWLAKFGAALMVFVCGLMGKRRFVRPWMIDFADEHFEFDIRYSQQELGWQPHRQIQADLPRMLKKLKEEPEIYFEKNSRRPW